MDTRCGGLGETPREDSPRRLHERIGIVARLLAVERELAAAADWQEFSDADKRQILRWRAEAAELRRAVE